VEESALEQALELWRLGTAKLLSGSLEEAVAFFTRSLEAHPTAEAYTFRGWAYSFEGRLSEAILECQKAIATDPAFGNPYNDIGCYLVEQGRPEEAVSWFEKAKRAARYEPRHFPYLNLGRLRAARGELAEAVVEFEGALAENPGDPVATKYLEALRFQVN
jgi:Tfp pilus assembly protein PilF